ncbi:hypothetical protein Ciccas_014032, partial [Cichlidogyrus casuarinus]
PEDGPYMIVAEALTGSMISLSWQPPPSYIGRSVADLEYEIRYTNRPSSDPSRWLAARVSGSRNTTLLTHLTSDQLYAIRIRPVNSFGQGPSSNSIVVTTKSG